MVNYIKKTLKILFVIIAVSNTLYAQDVRSRTANTNAWFMYFGNHKISERIGIHAEVQIRRHDIASEWQQLLLRTGIDYYLKDNHRITAGYAFIETHPYGTFAVPQSFPEHRLWQQFTTTQTLGKVNLNHRYRLEQRMIGNATTGEFKNGRYENRFRYMAKATMNITQSANPVFAALYNELFINFGKDVAYNIFDQNRLYGAIGFTFSPALKLEVGYLYQVVMLRNLELAATPKKRIEENHTLQVGLFSSIPFKKK